MYGNSILMHRLYITHPPTSFIICQEIMFILSYSLIHTVNKQQIDLTKYMHAQKCTQPPIAHVCHSVGVRFWGPPTLLQWWIKQQPLGAVCACVWRGSADVLAFKWTPLAGYLAGSMAASGPGWCERLCLQSCLLEYMITWKKKTGKKSLLQRVIVLTRKLDSPTWYNVSLSCL